MPVSDTLIESFESCSVAVMRISPLSVYLNAFDSRLFRMSSRYCPSIWSTFPSRSDISEYLIFFLSANFS